MAALVDVLANQLLDGSLGTAAYPSAPTTPIKVALNTAVGSTTAAGTEVGGGSYARQSVTFGSAATHVATSSNTQTYTNMPAATVTSVDVFDSTGTPVRKYWGNLSSSKTTNSGDTLSIASGSLTVALS